MFWKQIQNSGDISDGTGVGFLVFWPYIQLQETHFEIQHSFGKVLQNAIQKKLLELANWFNMAKTHFLPNSLQTNKYWHNNRF
jgi:hypothetical protein